MRYSVQLRNIEWDDGKGEYDVSKLPKSRRTIVDAPDEDAALEHAMNEISDTYGSLIQSTDAIVIPIASN
jgi:hypothetical protein